VPRAGHVGSTGWNDTVAPVRHKSIFWHNIWMECGRPRSGIIADIMRKTCASYHYAIRKVRRNANDIINETFADALIHNRGRDFWSEARKLPSSNVSVRVPGLFVPKTFRSQERIVPMGNFRSRALSFSGTFVPGERKFLGTFVPPTILRGIGYERRQL